MNKIPAANTRTIQLIKTSPMGDVRFNLTKAVKWKGSIILFIFSLVAFLLQVISIPYLIGLLYKKKKIYPEILTESWIIFSITTSIFIIKYWFLWNSNWHEIYFWFAIYLLSNSLGATLRDVFLSPNFYGGHIQVYDRQRWLALTLIIMIEVILSFSVLILYYNNKFNCAVDEPFKSVYVSAVSFVSLGYGDFFPISFESRVLIVCEIAFFLLFLSLKLPMAVSMIKVKDYEEENKRKKTASLQKRLRRARRAT